MSTPKQSVLLHNESLKKYNTWRVGGIAEKVYKPSSKAALQSYLAEHPDEPITFIGLGSNILIRDGGLKGTVIVLTNNISEYQIDDTQVYAQAGLPCAKLAKVVARAGLVGAEFFAGIPGTVGGALAMNAGAWGGETWPLVSAVEVITRQGEIKVVDQANFAYSYRTVNLEKNAWFLSATFRFANGNVKESEAEIKKLLNERAEKQPTGVLSCGSVFRNPENHHAAKLIEGCGLKGIRIGGAIVSEKHANFIVNDNKASAKDIEDLILKVQATVKQQTGYTLMPEVKMLGERP